MVLFLVQVQVAFHHPVRGHRAAVLAAMSSVQNDGPAARSGSVYTIAKWNDIDGGDVGADL